MKKSKPTLNEQIFEARFERGYRYLDKTGDAMLVLEDLLGSETQKLWMPEEISPKGATLKCPELDVSIIFDTYRAVVMQKPTDVDCPFDVIAQLLLATISGRFDLRTFIRFGSRKIHSIGMDSVEEAEAEAARLAPIKQWPLDGEFTTINSQVLTVQETADGRKGFRFALASTSTPGAQEKLDDRLNTPARLLPRGQKKALVEQLARQRTREKSPVAAVSLDIDYYVIEPESLSVEAFLNEGTEINRRIMAKLLGES